MVCRSCKIAKAKPKRYICRKRVGTNTRVIKIVESNKKIESRNQRQKILRDFRTPAISMKFGIHTNSAPTNIFYLGRYLKFGLLLG